VRLAAFCTDPLGRPACDSFAPFPPILGGHCRGCVVIIGAKGFLAATRLFQRTALCSDASIVPWSGYLVGAGRAPAFVAAVGAVFVVELGSVRAGCRSTVGWEPGVPAV